MTPQQQPAPRATLTLGVRLARAGRRETKQNNNNNKNNKRKQTKPQRNAMRQPQAGGPSGAEGGGVGSPWWSTAFGSFLPPRYLAILIPLWKFSQDISFPSRSPPREGALDRRFLLIKIYSIKLGKKIIFFFFFFYEKSVR